MRLAGARGAKPPSAKNKMAEAPKESSAHFRDTHAPRLVSFRRSSDRTPVAAARSAAGISETTAPAADVRRERAGRIGQPATAFVDGDMSRAATLIERAAGRFQQRFGAPLTYAVIAARAAIAALRDVPALDASARDEPPGIERRVHLGLALAAADSTDPIVPVIRDADGLSLPGLARAVADLEARARSGRLRPDELQGSTFILTMPGLCGAAIGAPRLGPPHVPVLGLSAITKRAVVVDEAIAIRPVMTMALAFDGAAGGMAGFRYLARVKEVLETLTDEALPR